MLEVIIIALIAIAGFSIGFTIVWLIWQLFRPLRQKNDVVTTRYITETVHRVEKVDIESIAAVPYEPEAVDEKDAINFFTLSRIDVLDYVESVTGDKQRFPVEYNIKTKKEDGSPDYIRCAEHCFGMMFDREDLVFVFALKMNAELLEKYSAMYTVQDAVPLGQDWYYVVIDQKFKRKQEVYNLLDACYDFALTEHARLKSDAKAAKAEQEALEKRAASLANLEDSYKEAEQEYKAMLAELKAQYANILISRQEIVENMRTITDPDLEILDRFKNARQPSSFKWKGKTFIMMYGTDMGIIMTLKIPHDLADRLASRHPEICRASFPAGKNWYTLPIDGAFKDKESVYRLIHASLEFIKLPPPPPVKKPKVAKPKASKVNPDGTPVAKKPAAKKPKAEGAAKKPAAKKPAAKKKDDSITVVTK